MNKKYFNNDYNMQPYSSVHIWGAARWTVHGEITGGRVQLTTSRVLIMHPERLGGFWPEQQVPGVHENSRLAVPQRRW